MFEQFDRSDLRIPTQSASFQRLRSIVLLLSFASCAVAQNPVIVQHGSGGSIIEIEGTNATVPPTCPASFTRRRMWFSAQEMAALPCWMNSMKLGVDSNGNTAAPPGLTTYQPSNGLDATKCLEATNEKTCSESIYLGSFYDYLVSKGYERGKTLDAVAYDWRASPLDFSKPNNYFSRLKDRVESMFTETGKKVTILGHSMGAATTAMFLGTYVNEEWKSKYIRMFISVAGAFSGSVGGVKRSIIGQDESGMTAATVRELVRTWPGAFSLVPADTAESKPYGTSSLFVLGNQDYTVADLPKLYSDVGLTDYSKVLDKLRGLYQTAPGVVTHCIMGKGFKTLSRVVVPDASKLSSYTEEYEDGDQMLTSKSQSVCTDFANHQKQLVTSQVYDGVDHVELIAKQNPAWDHIYAQLNPTSGPPSSVQTPTRPCFVLLLLCLFSFVFIL